MRIAVIGVGLIGGSVGLAAKERLDAEVIGYDPDSSAGEAALERGAVTSLATSVAEAVADVDTVFVAAPVMALPDVVGNVLSLVGPDCVVTDVGSTKRAVVEVNPDPRFVGGHPLAGLETAGVGSARADLFDGATWYLTPTSTTQGTLYERLHRLIGGLGAKPDAIDVETHDRMLATVSHLPHVLANVLVTQAAKELSAGSERLPATGPSFRDATRVAGANSGIWADIYRSNADDLAVEIESTIAGLNEFKSVLASGDAAAITEWNEAARSARERLLEQDLAGDAVIELRVSVPNRPGVVAQIALELGSKGVDINDMALYPTSDNSEGVIALWIAGDKRADDAAKLIKQLGFPVTRGS